MNAGAGLLPGRRIAQWLRKSLARIMIRFIKVVASRSENGNLDGLLVGYFSFMFRVTANITQPDLIGGSVSPECVC
jgi:hypothetical protein